MELDFDRVLCDPKGQPKTLKSEGQQITSWVNAKLRPQDKVRYSAARTSQNVQNIHSPSIQSSLPAPSVGASAPGPPR